MSAKTVVAFLCGVIVASTGTAAALTTTGRVVQLQRGDEAKYGNIRCQAVHVRPYSGFDCRSVPHYEISYGPSEIRVLRVRRVNNKDVHRTVFHVDPSRG
jgi:hypothetical protein